MRRIYLDVCCLNRPYDDLQIIRNQLEASAVLSILQCIRSGRWELVGSEVVDAEISAVSNPDRRAKVASLARLRSVYVISEATRIVRARQLSQLGFGGFDALHIACAESVQSDVLLTTDDNMLGKYRSHANDIMVKLANPLQWMAEVMMA